MPYSDQAYNSVTNLLHCYIQYPYLESSNGLRNHNWLIDKSGIVVPDNFDIYDHPDATKYIKDKITSALYYAFVSYFEDQDTGEYTFKVIHEFG